MLTKSDVTRFVDFIGLQETGLTSHEIIKMINDKIWSECGESLADFLFPAAPLEMQDLNETPDAEIEFTLLSDLSLQPMTDTSEQEIIDFRKVLA